MGWCQNFIGVDDVRYRKPPEWFGYLVFVGSPVPTASHPRDLSVACFNYPCESVRER